MVSDHFNIGSTLSFVERHGYALLLGWVFAEQSAIPLPSIPLLLAAGALGRAGRLNLMLAIACCTVGAVIGDTIWFTLGKNRGRKVLALLCRISLEPDSCVRQTENAFAKHGLSALLVSKFIPGLNTVAPPMAGMSKISYGRFALYDIAGSILWSGSCVALGYLFSEQLETLFVYVSRTGLNLFFLIAALLALWIGWKFVQRRRFLRALDVARITPEELQERLNAREELFVIDLRASVDEPELIPGAIRISPEEISAQSGRIPRDREIILFCS